MLLETDEDATDESNEELEDSWLIEDAELVESSELLDSLDTSGELDEDSTLELLENTSSEELLPKSMELLESTALLAALLLASLEVDPPQIAPVTVGRSAGTPLLLFPITPNSMVCPGAIRSFQPTPVAV